MALAALSVGCDADRSGEGGPGDGLPALAVSDSPTVVLEDDGTPEKLFTRIAARRLSDGSIVVGDQGASAIHVFGRDGRVLRRLARRGGGPGELQGDFRLVSRGDTVLAVGQPPMGANDVSVFHATDGYVGRFRPEATGTRMVTVLDALGRDALLVQRGGGFVAFMTPPAVGTLVRDSAVVGVMRAAGSDSTAVTWLPTVERAPFVTFPWRGGRVGVSMTRHRFGRQTYVVASGDRVWLVASDSGTLRAVDVHGRATVTARLPLAPSRFDDREVALVRDAELEAARSPLDSARVLATYDPAHRPPAMPLVAGALAGADGETWVQLFALDSAGAQRFVVVDRDGRAVARATVPAGLDVQHVGRDFVLGVRRDSLGVESVHEHAVRRP